MGSQYLIIPRMNVQSSNAVSTYMFFNGAPLTAASSFVHNMGLKCDFEDDIEGFACIHHDSQMLGDKDQIGYFLHQRKGASLINKKDYAKNGMTLSMQPTATRHLTISIVVKLSEDCRYNDSDLEAFLFSARFNGGQLISYEKPDIYDSLEGLRDVAPSGFWVLDRKDLIGCDRDPSKQILDILTLKSSFWLNRLESFIDQCRKLESLQDQDRKQIEGMAKCLEDLLDEKLGKERKEEKIIHDPLKLISKLNMSDKGDLSSQFMSSIKNFLNEYSWLSTTCIGYSCLTPFEERQNARNNKKHAYAEPLVGLTQYRSSQSIDLLKTDVFWTANWQNNGTLYILSQLH